MANPIPHVLIQHIHRLAGTPPAGDLPDAHLLARFADCRDEAAFAVLVKRHGPLVLAVCRRVLGDWHAAEDAFQDVFVLLGRKAGSLRQPERLGPWLYGVARRTALKARTRAARRAACERRAALPSTVELPNLAEAGELRGMLDAAVARLPEKHRLPFVLHYLQGEAVDTVACRLGWPRGTVATRLARARAQLRKGLARQGVTLSAASVAALATETAAATVPSRLAAGVMHAVAGTALIQGGLNAMFSMKWKSLLAAVLVAVAGTVGVGLLSAGAQGDKTTEAAKAVAPRQGEKQKPSADDVEEAIYRALREHGRWQGGGGYLVFVKRVQGRELIDAMIVKSVGSGKDAELFLARAQRATLRLDATAERVLFDLRAAHLTAAGGSGYMERKVLPVPLPNEQAGSSSSPKARRIVDDKYRQYQINLQLVRVDAGGRDLGPHGKGLVLAEPRLLAREDQEAIFHSGGEVAVPGAEPGTTKPLAFGLTVRVKVHRTKDGKLRLAAVLERGEVEQRAKGWRLRKSSVQGVELVKLGEDVKLVEKDSTGLMLHWVLIRVVREESVESRRESREAAPAEPRHRPLPAYIIGPPDVLHIDSQEGLLKPPLRGPYLVRPDGTVGLGTHGSVHVAGLTIEQARKAVAKVVHARLDPTRKSLKEVTDGLDLDVLAYNSKVYYVIIDRPGSGQTVHRFPITGNETVLDAIANIPGLPPEASRRRMWISRPAAKAGGKPQVLPVDWMEIVQEGQMATNYQLQPGDRLFLAPLVGPPPLPRINTQSGGAIQLGGEGQKWPE